MIFRDFCGKQDLDCPEGLLTHIVAHHYEKTGRKMRRCHPRDIVRVALDLIKFESLEPELTNELIDRAFELKFVAPNYEDE